MSWVSLVATDGRREDADNRVLALKARMEALKKKREAKKAKA